METKRTTFPLGPLSTSCLVPSSHGPRRGIILFVRFCSGTLSSQEAISSGGEALLSIPRETQWTVQALPTALSL